MKAVKWIATILVAYVGLVVAFESMIGILQPQAGETLVITTTNADGEQNDRVLAHLESDGKTYVAANHWPRAWYNAALANPEVEVTIDGERSKRTAVLLTGADHERVNAEHALPLPFRFITGFPPRYLLRLDPRS